MKETVFVWEDEGGLVRVSYPNWKSKKPHETDGQFLERISRKFRNPIAMNVNDIPKDRSQRNYWRVKNGVLVIQPAEGEPIPK
jgi:hypothetical protein